MAEYGVVAPRGTAHVWRLAEAIEDADSGLLEPVRELGALLLDQIADLDEKIAALGDELHERARGDEQTARLMSIPGIGPLSAMAILIPSITGRITSFFSHKGTRRCTGQWPVEYRHFQHQPANPRADGCRTIYVVAAGMKVVPHATFALAI